MMNMRQRMVLLAGLVFFPFALPATALADAGQQVEASVAATIKPAATQSCLKPGDTRVNLAQTGQTQCCKDHKGVCGCRAGKIVCCDGTASTESGCTCHGEEGFLE